MPIVDYGNWEYKVSAKHVNDVNARRESRRLIELGGQ